MAYVASSEQRATRYRRRDRARQRLSLPSVPRPTSRLADEREVHDVAVGLGARRVACEERARRLRRLVGDPDIAGRHDVVARHPVDAALSVDGEDDLIAGGELVDLAERMAMGD